MPGTLLVHMRWRTCPVIPFLPSVLALLLTSANLLRSSHHKAVKIEVSSKRRCVTRLISHKSKPDDSNEAHPRSL